MFASIALHFCMCLCIYVVADFVWSQEEHRNMGAWSFVAPRFENILGKKVHVLIFAGPDQCFLDLLFETRFDL